MKKEIHILSPATVSNVSCGFDILGFCLDTIADEIIVKKSPQKGIRITQIEGYDLPKEAKKNIAGVSAISLLEDLKPDCGFDIKIIKRIKPGSGIGSSAASAVGSVYAINELMGKPYTTNQLTRFALKGESMNSKWQHADNIAPAINGGFTLVKSLQPLEILNIPVPDQLYALVIHPQIEIKTSESRASLPENVNMNDSILQCANIGSLIHAMHTEDYELIKRSLKDAIVEPHRKKQIPFFDDIKQAAMSTQAIGMGISGSGPSMFVLVQGQDKAIEVKKAMQEVYEATPINFEIYSSKVNTEGVKIKSFT
ncbi:homoserine kinase [Flavobacteriaceae bacterium 14752]|uniref:homoserine kinase n=1 Tax=Mesohalobacter salilacus TaxID=2491711 RepID=UPI000F643619|nr:homoserine kinase [Flavobacteriaceae bacterium 14752]